MSPTRRDVLTMLSAAGAGVVLPAITFAHDTPVPAVHLRGLWTSVARGDANTMIVDIMTDPRDGTTSVTIACSRSISHRELISESPEVARFVGDLTDAIDQFAHDWDAMTDDERAAHRRRQRDELWRQLPPARTTVCPGCDASGEVVVDDRILDCPDCMGIGYVI